MAGECSRVPGTVLSALQRVGKLWFRGQIQLATCSGTAQELRMVFKFLKGQEKNQKKNHVL